MRVYVRCRRAQRGQKVPMPADDVWMARAVPGWATGGAGFTHQDVGVSSPAVPTLMYTQMQGYTHPKPAESHRRWEEGVLSACFKLEMACFPEERDKMIRKGRLCHVSTTTCTQRLKNFPA